MSPLDWNDRAVFDLLCRIDDGYRPNEKEKEMLNARERLELIYEACIVSIPKSIDRLSSLKYLSCIGTPIKSLPDTIGRIASLQQIDLVNSKITNLPETIGNLSNLRFLFLNGSPLVSIPKSVGKLTSLVFLKLRGTQIKALPDSFGNLSALRGLDLNNTLISSLPESFVQLSALQELDISYTKIKTLPEWIGNLPTLRLLNLAGLSLIRIPRSLAVNGMHFTSGPNSKYSRITNIANTTLSEQDINIFLEHTELISDLYEDVITLRECRVLFLGDGDSGKTYTIRRILHGCKKEKYDTVETPGVEIADYHVDNGNNSFDIHFWDFGGQELLHSMHRCFLTDQTCYVVTVKSRETKGTHRARYWLRNVSAFAPNSPILLFINCWENSDGLQTIDEPKLRKDFPNIVDVVYVSAKEATEIDFREKLLAPLTAMAASSDGCTRSVSRKWKAVRESITAESRTSHYLTKERYHRLCQQNRISEDNAPALLSYFNSLGICFSYHRDEAKKELADYKLLNPVWLTNAIYAIIEEGRTYGPDGFITIASIEQMLGNTAPDTVRGKSYRRTVQDLKYKRDECQYVMDVAVAYNLCYRVDKKKLFFPALCTNNTPDIAMEDKTGYPKHVEYLFRYTYLPDSVLHRLIIRCLKKGFAIRNSWLRGMVLDLMDTHRAILRMDDDETLKIEIWHREDHPAWELFPMLRNEILFVNETMNLRASEWIAEEEDIFPVIRLLRAHENNQDICWGDITGNQYSAEELVGRFFDSETISRMVITDKSFHIQPYQYHRHSPNDQALREAIYETYSRKCKYCNRLMEYEDMQIDHIFATNHLPIKNSHVELYLAQLKQRGFDLEKPDYVENYFPSCGKCNRGKSNAIRDAVTLREYHAVAAENLQKVLSHYEKFSQLQKQPISSAHRDANATELDSRSSEYTSMVSRGIRMPIIMNQSIATLLEKELVEFGIEYLPWGDSSIYDCNTAVIPGLVDDIKKD